MNSDKKSKSEIENGFVNIDKKDYDIMDIDEIIFKRHSIKDINKGFNSDDVKKSIEKNVKKASKKVTKEVDERNYTQEFDIDQMLEKGALMFEYELTEKEIFETMQNVYKIQFGKKRIIQSVLVLFVIIAITATILATTSESNFFYLILISVVLLILIWILPYIYNKWSARKNLLSMYRVKAILGKDKIRFFQDEVESTLQYNDDDNDEKNLKVYEYEDVFIFVYKDNNLFCIPKRAVLDQGYEVNDIREVFKLTLEGNYKKVK